MLQLPGLAIVAIVMWVVMIIPSCRNSRKGRMNMFYAQLYCRVIYARLAYFFTLFVTSESWNIASAACDEDGEVLFAVDNCEVTATQMLFIDAL